MDRANVHGTGVYETGAPLQFHEVVWKRKLGTGPSGFGNGGINGRIGSTPAVAAGTVYIGSADDYLFALDARTGTEKWKFRTAGASVNSPSVAGGVVYFSGGDGALHALDSERGTEIWSFSLPALPVGNPFWSSSWFSNPVIVGDIVYVGNQRNEFFALDAQTGLVKWRKPVEASVEYAPAVADGMVYFGTAHGSNIGHTETYVYALDAATGREIWKARQSDGVAGSPAVLVLRHFK
ncbi:MAG: PQQ-binding-like beta-propeller repeat protein [Chloroflexota bacterium]